MLIAKKTWRRRKGVREKKLHESKLKARGKSAGKVDCMDKKVTEVNHDLKKLTGEILFVNF